MQFSKNLYLVPVSRRSGPYHLKHNESVHRTLSHRKSVTMCSLRCPSPHSSSGDLIDLSDDASVRSAAGISSCHSITSSDVKSKVSPFDRMFLEVEDRMHKLFERYAQIKAQKASRTLKVPTKHEQLDIFQSTSSSETGGAIWLSRISSFVEHDIPNAEDVDGRTQRSYDTISSYSNFPSVQPIASSSRLSKTLTMKADNLAGKTSVGDSAESENGKALVRHRLCRGVLFVNCDERVL